MLTPRPDARRDSIMTITTVAADYSECKAKASIGSVPANYYHNKVERVSKEKKH